MTRLWLCALAGLLLASACEEEKRPACLRPSTPYYCLEWDEETCSRNSDDNVFLPDQNCRDLGYEYGSVDGECSKDQESSGKVFWYVACGGLEVPDAFYEATGEQRPGEEDSGSGSGSGASNDGDDNTSSSAGSGGGSASGDGSGGSSAPPPASLPVGSSVAVNTACSEGVEVYCICGDELGNACTRPREQGLHDCCADRCVHHEKLSCMAGKLFSHECPEALDECNLDIYISYEGSGGDDGDSGSSGGVGVSTPVNTACSEGVDVFCLCADQLGNACTAAREDGLNECCADRCVHDDKLMCLAGKLFSYDCAEAIEMCNVDLRISYP